MQEKAWTATLVDDVPLVIGVFLTLLVGALNLVAEQQSPEQ